MFIKLVLFINLILLMSCERSAFEAVLPLVDLATPSSIHSYMTATDLNYADGVTPAKIEVYVRNQKALPLEGLNPQLSITGSDHVLTPCTTTDADGRSTCWLYSTRAEAKIASVLAMGLSQNLSFQAVSGFRGRAAVVSLGQSDRLPSGHRITSMSGDGYSSFQLNDSLNQKRGETSILYIMPK